MYSSNVITQFNSTYHHQEICFADYVFTCVLYQNSNRAFQEYRIADLVFLSHKSQYQTVFNQITFAPMIWKWFGLFLIGSTKWAVAAGWILNADSPIIASSVALAGGITGIVVYTFFGEKISIWWKSKRKPKPFSINKRKRILVKVKQDYGLAGIALLSPVIISIPVGCIISYSMSEDKFKIMRFQFVSLLIWTLVFLGISLWVH